MFEVISHKNIRDEHLNASGLHLNPQGTKLLATNFIKHIRNAKWLSHHPNVAHITDLLLNTNACNVNIGKGDDRTQNNIAKNDILEDSFLLPRARF